MNALLSNHWRLHLILYFISPAFSYLRNLVNYVQVFLRIRMLSTVLPELSPLRDDVQVAEDT